MMIIIIFAITIKNDSNNINNKIAMITAYITNKYYTCRNNNDINSINNSITIVGLLILVIITITNHNNTNFFF